MDKIKFRVNCAFHFSGVIAALMSWAVNESVLWAIFHYLIGVIYVPYWIIRYTTLTEWVKSTLVRWF